MKKLSSIILSLLLVLALVSVPGTKSALAQEQTEQNVCHPDERTAWLWGIFDIQNEEDAPSTIFFFWANDIFEEVPFFFYDPLQFMAFYRTTSHLDLVPEGWGTDELGPEALADLYYECPELTATPTPTNTPTPTVEPTATATPTVAPTATPTVEPTATATPTTAVEPTQETTPTQGVTPTVEATPTTSPAPTDEVRPTEGYEENEEPTYPTPTETQGEETSPTVAPTPESTTAPTSNPVGGAGDGLSDGRSDGLSDGKSSPSEDSQKGVLGGATTMAKTGVFEKALMNLTGIFGALFVTAGVAIRSRMKKA